VPKPKLRILGSTSGKTDVLNAKLPTQASTQSICPCFERAGWATPQRRGAYSSEAAPTVNTRFGFFFTFFRAIPNTRIRSSQVPVFRPLPAEQNQLGGDAHPGKATLAHLIDVFRAGSHLRLWVLELLTIHFYRALLDHAQRFRGARHQPGFL
jgi:hypothetical protein